MIDPGDFNLGDIIRVAFTDKAATLDNLAKADIISDDEPAIEEQVRPPTDNELAEIELLAAKAAELQDRLKEVTGTMAGDLRKLKDQLKLKMLDHGLKELSIAGRPAIELTETSSRKPTRKAIIDVLEKAAVGKLTEEERRDAKKLKAAKADGKTKALNLWNAIEPTAGHSLKIPDPSPPEVDSPY